MATNSANNDIEARHLLTVLGERIRAIREQRKMTRKDLAQKSQVSERYLAQLEQGRGNTSIILLARVAAALRTDLPDLLRMRDKYTAEQILISDILRDLDSEEHKALLKLLSEQFAVPLESRRYIALVGLRGAGKSTQGKRLAEHLNIPFVHLGSEIEQLAGMSASEIFSLSGQTGYQRLAGKAFMQTLRQHDRCVLETGGSIVTDSRVLNNLLTMCFVVWLRAEPAEHMRRLVAQGDVRPMENQGDAMADLRHILADREELYARAHATIDTNDKSIEECVAELLRLTPEVLQNSMNSVQGA